MKKKTIWTNIKIMMQKYENIMTNIKKIMMDEYEKIMIDKYKKL